MQMLDQVRFDRFEGARCLAGTFCNSHPTPHLIAAQYQAAITQANGALAIEPKFAPAYWAVGVSCGMLGQWDQAVANLQSAAKIDKNYNDGKAALKWAQAGQKAAKNGGVPKEQAPAWK